MWKDTHAYIYTYTHTYIHAEELEMLTNYMDVERYACIHIYIHTYIHTCRGA